MEIAGSRESLHWGFLPQAEVLRDMQSMTFSPHSEQRNAEGQWNRYRKVVASHFEHWRGSFALRARLRRRSSSRALIAFLSSDARVPHQAVGGSLGDGSLARPRGMMGTQARVSLDPLAASPARSLRADDIDERAERLRNHFDREPVRERRPHRAPAGEPEDVREPRGPARTGPPVGPCRAPVARIVPGPGGSGGSARSSASRSGASGSSSRPADPNLRALPSLRVRVRSARRSPRASARGTRPPASAATRGRGPRRAHSTVSRRSLPRPGASPSSTSRAAFPTIRGRRTSARRSAASRTCGGA